jgi:hypothetical protein
MESGRIEAVQLDPWVARELSPLVEEADKYFILSAGSELVPTRLLIASHIRNDGVINANRLMRSAAEGIGEKRAPLTIRALLWRFVVLDGNSTFINAKFSNWGAVPCDIVP